MDAPVAVEQLRRFFEARPDGVVCVYLFGSTARGGAGAGSDVDVGVLLDHDPPAPLERIRFEVRARNAWFDLKPILDRYRRSGGSVRG